MSTFSTHVTSFLPDLKMAFVKIADLVRLYIMPLPLGSILLRCLDLRGGGDPPPVNAKFARITVGAWVKSGY